MATDKKLFFFFFFFETTAAQLSVFKQKKVWETLHSINECNEAYKFGKMKEKKNKNFLS